MTDVRNMHTPIDVEGERMRNIETMLHRSRRVLIGALFLVACFIVLSVGLQVRAHTPEPVPTAVLLGRLCVNEAGFNTLDCAAIGHIRLRSAITNHRDIRAELLAQHGQRSLRADRATNPAPDDTRPWIGDLDDHLPPRHWPAGVSWEQRGLPGWAGILETATGVLNGDLRDPCRQGRVRPNTWGGPRVDAERFARGGWLDSHCGATRNRFGRWARQDAPTEPTAGEPAAL
jgi:hypothetical protein